MKDLMANTVAENVKLAEENSKLEHDIRTHYRLVDEKHVSFNRMRSQSMREDLVEFEELNEGDDFPLHALEDEGGGGGAGHEIAEQEVVGQNDPVVGNKMTP